MENQLQLFLLQIWFQTEEKLLWTDDIEETRIKKYDKNKAKWK